LIQTCQLSYCYPGGEPINFPDVQIAQGSVLLVKGPSGCGKSTWLAVIAGLVKPVAGGLTVAGQALGSLNRLETDAWRARSIGFLPQKLHLSAALTVEQNLAMAQWAAGQKQDRERIFSALKALGVDDLGARKPHQISGGQAQRVALARAVLLQPQVILADEPTASLDDEAAASAVVLLVETARQHKATLVIATHDARVAPLISNVSSFAPHCTTLKLTRPSTGVNP
jgi:putative ABC transport system ATP-binding protein